MKRWQFSEDYARRQEKAGGLYPPDAEDAAVDPDAPLQTRGECPPESNPGPQKEQAEPSVEKEKLLLRRLDHWVASMERMGLADYVRYLDNRKRLFWSNFWGGVARGVGTAVGFTILGAILVIILQDLAKHNLPVIGDALAQIVTIVQMRMK